MPPSFSKKTRRILEALARVAIPAGRRYPPPDGASIDRLEALFARQTDSWRLAYEASVRAFDVLAIARHGRPFHQLAAKKQLVFMDRLYQGGFPGRMLLRVVLSLVKLSHFDSPELFERGGCVYRQPPLAATQQRFLERAVDAAGLGPGAEEEVEAEVVVVGTGAGGAAVAAELAEMGVAVALVEEGHYYHRQDFNGRPMEMMARMYRRMGLTSTVGNCIIPVPLGRCVGGTTAINSGTCYRIPARVLRKWREDLGLGELEDELEPFYAKVEQIIQATPAELRHVGGIARVIAAGCGRLGYRRHGPLTRNAPDCDGSSLCCFGCPTDAKRSTNVSYVPLALRYGANLFYNARVERVLLEQGRAAGVEAVTASGGRLRIRAAATVIACGSVGTPALLLRQGLANSSGQLGRNLSIHPAVAMFGVFPGAAINGCTSIPQGYGIEEFHDEGILFEGVFVPLDAAAGSLTFFGDRFTEVMERHEEIGSFGFLIEDTSRGRVMLGPGGRPFMTYVMNDHDVARLKRGVEILARVFMAAEAEAVFTQMAGFVELRDMRDLERFRRHRHHARDFDLTAHHPLGTARMGRNPASSVVGPTHEAHDVPGLFICDGSSVPSSIGVNPMMTIMALATRAAGFVAERVG
jgi:choline dehydrogenase-like flavoprotein